MSTDHDRVNLVDAWLREDEHVSATGIVDDVLDQVGSLPQRRVRWVPDGFRAMNRAVRLALTTAAAVVIGVVVVSTLAPRFGGFGGPPSSSQPSGSEPAESSASSQPSPAPTPEARIPESDLILGRHAVTVDGVRFSFDIQTTSWEGGIKRPYAYRSLAKSLEGPQGAEAIIYWVAFPDGAYADLCQGLQGLEADASAADIVDAVASALGTALVTGPTEVAIGGYAASHVVVQVVEDLGCDPGYFYTWDRTFPGAFWNDTMVGDTIRVWVVEVGGVTLFIAGESTSEFRRGPDSPDPREFLSIEQQATLDREIYDIVTSIRFE